MGAGGRTGAGCSPAPIKTASASPRGSSWNATRNPARAAKALISSLSEEDTITASPQPACVPSSRTQSITGRPHRSSISFEPSATDRMRAPRPAAGRTAIIAKPYRKGSPNAREQPPAHPAPVLGIPGEPLYQKSLFGEDPCDDAPNQCHGENQHQVGNERQRRREHHENSAREIRRAH